MHPAVSGGSCVESFQAYLFDIQYNSLFCSPAHATAVEQDVQVNAAEGDLLWRTPGTCEDHHKCTMFWHEVLRRVHGGILQIWQVAVKLQIPSIGKASNLCELDLIEQSVTEWCWLQIPPPPSPAETASCTRSQRNCSCVKIGRWSETLLYSRYEPTSAVAVGANMYV